MKQTRIYIVGAGAIARAHAAAIALLPDAGQILLRVSDPQAQALKTFQKAFPQAVTFLSHKEMLASEPAGPGDIVINATPPFLHAPISLEALSSGRHVLCEKPLALMTAEAQQVVLEAAHRGLLFACCSSRMLGGRVPARVREILASGRLGRLYHAKAVVRATRFRSGIEYQPGSRWFLDRNLNGGGVVADWAPYDMAMLADVFRPRSAQVLQAWMATPRTEIDPTDCVFDVEHHAGATLRLDIGTGTPLTVDYERSFCTHGDQDLNTREDGGPPPTTTCMVEGTTGAVSFEWIPYEQGYTGRIVLTHDKGGRPVRTVEQLADPDLPSVHSRPLLFFHKTLAGEKSPSILGTDALFNFEVLRAIYDCAETGTPQTVTRS